MSGYTCPKCSAHFSDPSEAYEHLKAEMREVLYAEEKASEREDTAELEKLNIWAIRMTRLMIVALKEITASKG